jgi:hypothetical protein
MEIDLSKFNLDAGSTHPYQDIVLREGMFLVYEGAFGKRYRYFEIPAGSSSGEACRAFYNRYYLRNEHRFSYAEDGQVLMSLAEADDDIVKLSGVDAYYKYWNHFTEEDKLNTHFNVIPFFKALKEWYRLRFADALEKNRGHFVNAEIKRALIQQWADKLLQEMTLYLEPPVPPRRFSVLSMPHVRELGEFYNWVAAKHRRNARGVYLKSLSRVGAWIVNNTMMATIIGGIIALVIGTILLREWHIL